MTLNKLMTVTAIAGMMTAAFANTVESASTLSGRVEQIVAQAKKAQLEAEEIARQLKDKKADLNSVNTRMQYLEQHVAKVGDLVRDFEAAHGNLTGPARDNFDRVKLTSQLLQIFLDQKKTRLADGDISGERTLLRAKAEGIAKRAEMLQRAALMIRG